MGPTGSQVKPGHHTTEFYLTTAAAVFGALLASGLFPAGGLAARILGVVTIVATTIAYQYQRTKLKTAPIDPTQNP